MASPEGVPVSFTTTIGAQHALHTDAYYFPIRLRLHSDSSAPTANLSPAARAYLSAVGVPDPDADADTAGLIWMHALAIGYSPAYLGENADGIRDYWPRVPLPETRDALLASAELGRQVATLLDTENSVTAITSAPVRPEMRTIAPICRAGGGPLDPSTDLAVTAGWGHAGKQGATMPGKGKIVRRSYTLGELDAIREGASALGLTVDQAIAHLGDATCDIYLNDTAYWENVPAGVWAYTIGGYQVIKKWLSYRERDLLGRPLTPDEAREVTNMARRIAAILLLEPALDENYRAVKSSCYRWPDSGSKG